MIKFEIKKLKNEKEEPISITEFWLEQDFNGITLRASNKNVADNYPFALLNINTNGVKFYSGLYETLGIKLASTRGKMQQF